MFRYYFAMNNLKVLNSKEKRGVLELIKEFKADIKLDYIFLKNNEGKIFLLSNDFSKINTERLRINNLGLYFGKIENNEIRLTIEGSQIVGPKSKKAVELDEKQVNSWISGGDIKISNEEGSYFVILKHKNDYLGCGRFKNGIILNFIPKERRISLEKLTNIS